MSEDEESGRGVQYDRHGISSYWPSARATSTETIAIWANRPRKAMLGLSLPENPKVSRMRVDTLIRFDHHYSYSDHKVSSASLLNVS